MFFFGWSRGCAAGVMIQRKILSLKNNGPLKKKGAEAWFPHSKQLPLLKGRRGERSRVVYALLSHFSSDKNSVKYFPDFSLLFSRFPLFRPTLM